MKNEKETIDKPEYDGRQEYYKIVGSLIDKIVYYSDESNYNKWYNILRQLFSLVMPYITKTNKENIKQKLGVAHNRMTRLESVPIHYAGRTYLMSSLENLLHEITSDVYDAGKYMLLPIKTQDVEEYNERLFADKLFQGAL